VGQFEFWPCLRYANCSHTKKVLSEGTRGDDRGLPKLPAGVKPEMLVSFLRSLAVQSCIDAVLLKEYLDFKLCSQTERSVQLFGRENTGPVTLNCKDLEGALSKISPLLF
jgi:hypothetical protein